MKGCVCLSVSCCDLTTGSSDLLEDFLGAYKMQKNNGPKKLEKNNYKDKVLKTFHF